MLSFISAKEAAEKWNISQRRVSVLASENRINGAMMVGNMWIIPSNAENRLIKGYRWMLFQPPKRHLKLQ